MFFMLQYHLDKKNIENVLQFPIYKRDVKGWHQQREMKMNWTRGRTRGRETSLQAKDRTGADPSKHTHCGVFHPSNSVGKALSSRREAEMVENIPRNEKMFHYQG